MTGIVAEPDASGSNQASPEGTAPVLYVAEAGVADEAAILDEDGLRRWLEERTPQRVAIRADRRMKAAELFGYVNVLEAAGVGDVELVVLGE